MLLTTYTVNSNADTNTGTATTGTLRYVLTQLDSSGGFSNTITFDLPSKQQTIAPGSPLPTITNQVDIEGSTQPGFSGAPLIAITGDLLGVDVNGVDGLTLGNGSSGSTIENLAISGFSMGDGIDIFSSSDAVFGCYIGTDISGVTAEGNLQGIDVEPDSSGNTIDGNVISANSSIGILIYAPCLVFGNQIGTDASGTAVFQNAGAALQANGVNVEGSGATIGGTTPGKANVISGNGIGINISGDGPGGVVLNGPCLVEGNVIGPNATDTGAFQNKNDLDLQTIGIAVDDPNTTIGGTSPDAANIIWGNQEGINITASCLVEGNLIGTNATGAGATSKIFAGTVGIVVSYSSAATIGGTAVGAANVISGNTDGIYVSSPCLIDGNLIGTNVDGTGESQNTDGEIQNIGIDVEASGVTIGGTSAAAANTISGNESEGIDIQASCLVEGNLIGTNATGDGAVPNAGDGILVGQPGATIGGTSAGAANVISGNGTNGIDLGASCVVEGNRIGTDTTGANPVPNQGVGVYVHEGSAAGNLIGAFSEGNIIAFNAGPGVATAAGTTGSSIEYNAIFSNGGPGIDLNDDGVTPNTPNGANNAPILTSASGGSVSGTLNASPNTEYIVDFYANLSSDDLAARPQGRDYLTSTIVDTNAAGDALFNVRYTPMPGLPILTATATDAGGTTSEFSAPLSEVTSLGGVMTPFAHSVEFVAGTLFSRVVASFADTDPRAFSGQFTAMIDWGDSTAVSVGVVLADGAGFDVTGSHSYNVAKTDPITVTITDAVTGATVTANSTALVDPVPITIQTKNFAVTGGAIFQGRWRPSPTATRARAPRFTPPRSTGATTRP